MANFIQDLVTRLLDNISETIRKFSAFSLVLFFLGSLYGMHLDKIGAIIGVDPSLLLLLPLLLAALAYLFLEVAILIFIVLVVLSLILFI